MRKSEGRQVFSLADFALGEEIGKGGFGTVYKAICKQGRLRNTEVAIKKVSSKQRSELVRQEVENHQSIDHENIVKFYGCFKDNNESYIIMELCSRGSLRHYIRDNGAFSQEQAVAILRQIVDAIQHLHRKGICHRDLTSGNVLVHRVRHDGVVHVKICDFGLAKVMNAGRAAHTVAGTPGYMDPHVMNRNKYGKEVDVYSLGCLLYTMLTGSEPVPDGKSRFPRLNILETGAVNLIDHLTDPDVNSRMKLEDVIRSPFMSASSYISADHPTSIRSRRSMEHKSRERRAITEQGSTRERSKSRGPLKEINHSPSASARQLYRSRSSSLVRAARSENANPNWPINIDRLEGKHHEDSDGYRLKVESNEVVLTENENGRKIMVVRMEGRGQKVGMAEYSRGHDNPTWEWFRSMDRLTKSQLGYYSKVLRLLEDIRWKVAKVIFNNSSICKGVIRLMENGDMRMKDNLGIMYSVKANSNTVYEGDPKKPSGIVSNLTKRDEILGYRDVCKKFEAAMESLPSFKFPFVSYYVSDDTNTVRRNVREAMAEPSRVRAPSGLGGRNEASREVSVQRVSRAKSTCSYDKKSVADGVMTNWSAPGGSMKSSITITKSKSGRIMSVKDKSDGSSLRKSSATPNQYIYTDSNNEETRFIFTGDYSALTSKQAYLMEKLYRR